MADILASLHPLERKVLAALRVTTDFLELQKGSNLSEVEVMRALQWLAAKGLVTLDKKEKIFVNLDKNGLIYREKGLPEIRLFSELKTGSRAMTEVTTVSREEIGISVGTLRKSGLLSMQDGKLVLSGGEYSNLGQDFLQRNFPLELDTLNADEKKVYSDLKKRKELVVESVEKSYLIEVTSEGHSVLQLNLDVEYLEGLTPELLSSGKWKDAKFRHYDVTGNVPSVTAGRIHPLTAVIDLIREVFIEMGFSEMKGPMVETAFWCMDSMWIPQDHPAREEQDTFYLPYEGELPRGGIVEKVARVHEDGGDTGSSGYGYKWDPAVARQMLLRTHTTASTFRNFGSGKVKSPAKYFYVGRVFRNEAIDATHLPEFHQVEGFVMDDGLTLADLMGFIKAFYAKLGFDKIRFKPTYNPYTEPSLEAHYFDEKSGKWLELINSGMFRPESLAPYGIDKPVIAWGLGLERLAMLMYKQGRLRDIFGATCDLDWLRNYEPPRRKD